MVLATWKDLCVDAVDPVRSAAFWADALGLQTEESDPETLRGPTPQHTVWVCRVPEAKTVKNRVHLDVHCAAIGDLSGATVLEDTSFRWILLSDPDGQEFCAFVREQPPAYRLYELVVDCADPGPITDWWAGVFGVVAHREAGQDEPGYGWIPAPAGAPFENISFVPVPEPKTVKNRVHWDVTGVPADLVNAGATLLRTRGDDRRWDVLADPDGNEFCVFSPG
ncbi:MAG TPA: VOC family protein [Sporichthyaceae bacterium]|jgi:catechol 2,3-dioxygenase-like lactoylglutathione lyase family enzyme